MTTKKIYGPWIKWDGGECPVPPDTLVGVKLRCRSSELSSLAKRYYWHHNGDGADIVSYRAITEQTDLEAAEKLLRENGYTIIPPAKPLTFEDDLRHQPPLMTATEINALPHKAREYIHQLEANTDPSGMVRENMQLLDTNKGLQIMYRNRTDELDRVKQAMELARYVLATYQTGVTYMPGKGCSEEPLTFDDVVPMTEAPPEGTDYWVAHPFSRTGVEPYCWDGTYLDQQVLRHRMAYLEREHALIAAQHIFGLKGGEL